MMINIGGRGAAAGLEAPAVCAQPQQAGAVMAGKLAALVFLLVLLWAVYEEVMPWWAAALWLVVSLRIPKKPAP